MVDGIFKAVESRRVAVFAPEQQRRLQRMNWTGGGSQSNASRVKVEEQVSVAVVNAAVRFVGDNEIKESHVERLEALHHGGVGGEIDSAIAVLVSFSSDERPGF